MLKEFKEFAMRGNVLDMAIGIIIGAAFGKIVSSFVADVLMPPIGLLLGQSGLLQSLHQSQRSKLPERRCRQGRGCRNPELRNVSQYGDRLLDRGLCHLFIDQAGQPPHGKTGRGPRGPDHQGVPALPVPDSDQGHTLRSLHFGRLAGARRTAPHHPTAGLPEKRREMRSPAFFRQPTDPFRPGF